MTSKGRPRQATAKQRRSHGCCTTLRTRWTSRSTTYGGANNVTIIIAPGRTPVQAPFPPLVTPESFITPTWPYHILPPTSASTVTFTAPLTGSITYSTSVPVPQESDDPPKRVDKGDENSCNGGGFFNLLFRALISPCMPLDVGI
ncbi:hypothetical protein EXIGLDRAFT_56178 [Exidia glandulosa HHB12029]|uniref:Uncharacterized protein n=1 Tax=Exidia glandulosa HHB12029 TaxID=1314781 RepID=A0A166MNA1_EXIGL|nr:hypothetical protein EXIGLDRAFT_56178 [Exidia glandulosa HHB12029]